jgi:hypothetical protein
MCAIAGWARSVAADEAVLQTPDELEMYAGFVLRHPRTPGPRRQVRVRSRRLLRRGRASLRRRLALLH